MVELIINTNKKTIAILGKLINKDNIKFCSEVVTESIKFEPSLAKKFAQLFNEKNIVDHVGTAPIIDLIEADPECASIIAKNAINDSNIGILWFIIPQFINADESLKSYFAKWEEFFKEKWEEFSRKREERKKTEEEEIEKKKKESENNHYSPCLNNSMISMDDAYKILDISKKASLKEIKMAYRKLAQQYHPDHNKNKSKLEQKEAEKKMVAINEAYELLGRRSRL